MANTSVNNLPELGGENANPDDLVYITHFENNDSNSPVDRRFRLSNFVRSFGNNVITGILTITNQITLLDSNPLQFKSNSGSASNLLYATLAGVLRWTVSKNGEAETGSNAGANYTISAFSDTGSYLGDGLKIYRDDQRVVFNGGIANVEQALGQPGQILLSRPSESARWALEMTSDTETGSDVGSDFVLNAYTDGGNYKATAFRVNRDTQDIEFFSPFTATSAEFSGQILANNGLRSNANFQVSRPAGVAGQLNLSTNGSTRWSIEKTSDAESGGNAGSDLILNSYSDSGGYLATLFNFRRQTGTLEIYADSKFFGKCIIPTTPPANSSAPGEVGEIRASATHLFICTATNTWRRVALAVF
jgi:hypothetical protein